MVGGGGIAVVVVGGGGIAVVVAAVVSAIREFRMDFVHNHAAHKYGTLGLASSSLLTHQP